MIYNYIADSDKYECLEFASRHDRTLDKFGCGVRLAGDWKPIPAKIDDSVGRPGDFPSAFGQIPVLSLRAWTLLEPLIGESVEALPLKCPGRNLFALNVLAVVDCLDQEKCEFKYYSSGKIMRVAKFAFRNDPTEKHHMFSIPETSGDVFISDQFRKLVEQENLKGLQFKLVRT